MAEKLYSNIQGKTIKLSYIVDKAIEKIGQDTKSKAVRAVNEMRNAELQILSGQRSGKIYRKPHTKKATYQASAPGEAPARLSGRLRLSWKGQVKAEQQGDKLIVKSILLTNCKYADILESKKNRPYKDKIIQRAMPKIRQIYRQS